jgi:tetratricopeptide (TPR) repeat protein
MSEQSDTSGQRDDSRAIEPVRMTRPFVRAAATYAHRAVVPGIDLVIESTDGSDTIPDGVRRLCAAVDIAAWSSRTKGGARAETASVVHEALRLAGESIAVPIDRWKMHAAGDGALIVFPAEIDESAMIAAITRTLATELGRYNKVQPAGDRLRVRLSIAQGTLHATPFGFSDDVTIGVARLVNCSVLRAALVGYPASDVALIVSEDVFLDVIAHERHGLRVRSFWPVVAADKEFQAPAWIHVPDRASGPSRPPGADLSRLAPPGPRSGDLPRIVGLMPRLFPGWIATPATAGPDERIDAARVAAALETWRLDRPEPDAAQPIPPVPAREREVLKEASELVAAGRYRSAFDHIAKQLSGTAGTRALPCGLARVLVHAAPGRHADAVRELLDWVLVHHVEGVTDALGPLLMRAENSYAIGHLESAVIDLRQLLQALPVPGHEPGPAALLRLGDCLTQAGDTTGAAAVWKQLLAVRPVHPHASLRLAYRALAEDEPEAAERHLRRAEKFLRSCPGDVRPMKHAVALGQYAVRRAKGDDAGAEHYLEVAANSVPDDPVTAAEQAILAAGKGDGHARRRCTQVAVARAICAGNGLPVLDLLHDFGLLDDDQHRQACAAHRERH